MTVTSTYLDAFNTMSPGDQTDTLFELTSIMKGAKKPVISSIAVFQEPQPSLRICFTKETHPKTVERFAKTLIENGGFEDAILIYSLAIQRKFEQYSLVGEEIHVRSINDPQQSYMEDVTYNSQNPVKTRRPMKEHLRDTASSVNTLQALFIVNGDSSVPTVLKDFALRSPSF